MKVREDFVTNSSSSSFVIGKKDDASATIESVFQMIKGFYKDFLAKRDEAKEYVATHPKMNIRYVEKDGYETFECTISDWDKRMKALDKFEDKFGFSTWECFDYNYDWLDCESYLDYERYWLNKMRDNSDWKVHAPFTIADFLEEKEIEWLHFHFNSEYDTHTHKVNSTSSVLDWYFPYIEEAFRSDGCDGCKRAEWCDKEVCMAQRESINEHNVPEDKACLYMLGRVCVHSESGYIPSYVVDALEDVSEYYCNHMG